MCVLARSYRISIPQGDIFLAPWLPDEQNLKNSLAIEIRYRFIFIIFFFILLFHFATLVYILNKLIKHPRKNSL